MRQIGRAMAAVCAYEVGDHPWHLSAFGIPQAISNPISLRYAESARHGVHAPTLRARCVGRVCVLGDVRSSSVRAAHCKSATARERMHGGLWCVTSRNGRAAYEVAVDPE